MLLVIADISRMERPLCPLNVLVSDAHILMATSI